MSILTRNRKSTKYDWPKNSFMDGCKSEVDVSDPHFSRDCWLSVSIVNTSLCRLPHVAMAVRQNTPQDWNSLRKSMLIIDRRFRPFRRPHPHLHGARGVFIISDSICLLLTLGHRILSGLRAIDRLPRTRNRCFTHYRHADIQPLVSRLDCVRLSVQRHPFR
jgi:hypothetical protein